MLFIGVAAGYLALAQFVLFLNDPVNLGAGFWPAAGFIVGLLIVLPVRCWGWVLAGVAVAELGGDLAHGYPLGASLWWTVGNVVGPLVGALIFRRWQGVSDGLVPLLGFLRFVVAAVIMGPLVGASIGSVGTWTLGDLDWWTIWPKYVIGDGLGVLVVAPAVLFWMWPVVIRLPSLETVVLAVCLPIVAVVAFSSWAGELSYVVVPFLMWAALRHGNRGAALAVFTVTFIANWFTAIGDGPFVSAGDGTHAVTQLQVFLVVAGVSTFIVAALVEDLVERSAVEADLTRQANTDPLTGLPNRAALAEVLDPGRSRSRFPEGIGVFVCDLDHFKVVNDGLGHQAGDEVLIEVADRMRSCVRPDDVVARLSGDEFVVVMNAREPALNELADRLLSAVAAPMTLSTGTKLNPSLSVGIAHSPAGVNPTTLLRDADSALYRAKDLGRGRFHRFDDELRLQVIDRLVIQTELHDALANDDLYCVYQPEVVLSTGELFGFEALSRWEHPTLGQIPPDRFIPIIEDMGAAQALFHHVLEEALTTQAHWAKRLGFHPPIAINVSARELVATDIVGATARALASRTAPAECLWIEVTESTLVDKVAADTLLALHELGVRLAIDDFGMGWSSMSRLAAFPWDLLKIDRSFVAALGDQTGEAEKVVSSTIAMAHSMGILTVGEGVETETQRGRLAELGCDVVQGFLIGRPLPARDAIEHVIHHG